MIRLIVILLLIPLLAYAQPGAPIHATYSAYAAGFNVVNMEADFQVSPADYKVRLVYRTAGAFGAVVDAKQDTTVQGRFIAGHPAPVRFFSAGHARGKQRITQIDYAGRTPQVRQLVPPNNEEREDVPVPLQANTIDTLSAMAELLRQVGATGTCDGSVTTFDGRRLAELTAHTAGMQALESTSRSSFAGPALRCDFVGVQRGGFLKDADASARRPLRGSAWFAAALPGGPMLPVRMQFETRFFGDATMYLTAAR